MTLKQRKQVVQKILDRYEAALEDIKKVYFLGVTPTEFAAAIVGTMEINGKLKTVYSEWGVLQELRRLHKWGMEDANEWYERNIVRSLPYYPNVVIMDTL